MKQNHVVGAILVDQGKILCAKRGPGRALANLWEFPGGKIETGESPREALQREIQEELQVVVKVAKEAFETTSYSYDFGVVHLTTFLCRLESGVPQLTEHVDLKWLAPAELMTVTWAPADIPAVEKLQEQGV